MNPTTTSERTPLWLYVVSPIFTGQTEDEASIAKRLSRWDNWRESASRQELNEACGKNGGKTSICVYYPGRQVYIPHEKDPNAVEVIMPVNRESKVPKGFVARLHLLVLLETIDRERADPNSVIFACIDGSGAFEFDSLKLLIDRFNEDSGVDVVFGKRPTENSGMPPGRKEIEEFEQYLLFRYRSKQIMHTFSHLDLTDHLLPDGQAGCWAFRLSAASRLALTGSAYEIEYDLLASTLDAGLKATFTKPLLMSLRPRHSSASRAVLDMSMKKLAFIQRKLGLERRDVADVWIHFAKHFAGSPILNALQPDYENAVLKYCEERVG